MRKGYGSRPVCVCVCVCVSTTKSATYLVYTSKTKCHRVLYDVFKVFVVWLSLKTLCSRVLASFAGHHRLPCSPVTSRWTKETAVTSFQHEECACLAIAPIIRPTYHSSELTNCQASWFSALCNRLFSALAPRVLYYSASFI